LLIKTCEYCLLNNINDFLRAWIYWALHLGVKDESLDLSPVICPEQALSMNHFFELPYDLRHTYKIDQVTLFGTHIFLGP